MHDDFLDHYETLQLSPNADADTLQRIFRLLAKRYHPDNPQTGDRQRFARLLEAHKVLSDPNSRAASDLEHDRRKASQRGVVSQVNTSEVLDEDQQVRANILVLLYAQRRRDFQNPGMGDYMLTDMLEIPMDQLVFHLWYLRGRGFVARLEDGSLSITVEGVDQVERARRAGGPRRQITQQER
jgi:curved DNA-binding protein CbpA